MEVGLIVGPVYPGRGEISSERAFALHLEFADRAIENGFTGLSLNHHYLVGPDAQCFQPIPMAALMLARHPTAYVATTIFILPYHGPVEVAEQVATLDQISPGKFLFGIGRGYKENEAIAAGIERSSRSGRFAETIAALKLLWGDGASSFEGEYYRFEDADIGVRPATPGGPLLLLAADKLRTVRAIPGLGGDYWLPSARHSHDFLRKAVPAYKEALEAAGRTFVGLPFTRDVCVADDERTAIATMERSYERLMHMQSGWGQPGERYDRPFAELRENRVILGSPEQVAEELIALHREYGAEFVFIRVYTPGMDPELALEMIDRTGQEVLPIIRQELAATGFFSRVAESTTG